MKDQGEEWEEEEVEIERRQGKMSEDGEWRKG